MDQSQGVEASQPTYTTRYDIDWLIIYNMDTITIELFYVRGTELAYCFTQTQLPEKGEQFWLPKSQLKSIVKLPPDKPANCYPVWIVEMPEWLAEKKNLA